MHSVAIVVLNYNTPEMTAGLACYLRDRLEYGDKNVYVVDNGSKEPLRAAELRLPENLGFTKGMQAGYLHASAQRKAIIV